MDDKHFKELMGSVEEGMAMLRGEKTPSRRFVYADPDVKAIRQKLHQSQSEFAALLGIGLGTLRHWEQGRRRPTGAARVLLRVVSEHPETMHSLAEYHTESSAAYAVHDSEEPYQTVKSKQAKQKASTPIKKRHPHEPVS